MHCHHLKKTRDTLLNMYLNGEEAQLTSWDVNRILRNCKCHPELNNCNVYSFLTFYTGNHR